MTTVKLIGGPRHGIALDVPDDWRAVRVPEPVLIEPGLGMAIDPPDFKLPQISEYFPHKYVLTFDPTPLGIGPVVEHEDLPTQRKFWTFKVWAHEDSARVMLDPWFSYLDRAINEIRDLVVP